MVHAVAEQAVQSFLQFDRHNEDAGRSTRGPAPAPGAGRDAIELSGSLRDRPAFEGKGTGRGLEPERAFGSGSDFRGLGRSLHDFFKGVAQAFSNGGTRSLFDRQDEVPATVADDPEDDGTRLATAGDDSDAVRSDDEGRVNRGMVFKALNGMGRDLRHMLREFGLGGGFAADLAHAFAKGAKEAFKQGLDFAAEITVAAARETTSITDNGIEQSLSLVARQLSIEINHDEDTVSISIASLSVESSVEIEAEFAATEDGAADGGTSALPAVEAPDTDAAEAAVDDAATPLEADQKTREAAAVLQDLVAFESRFQLHIVERLRNEDGHSVTRLLVDAAIRISQPENEDEAASAAPNQPASQQLAIA